MVIQTRQLITLFFFFGVDADDDDVSGNSLCDGTLISYMTGVWPLQRHTLMWKFRRCQGFVIALIAG